MLQHGHLRVARKALHLGHGYVESLERLRVGFRVNAVIGHLKVPK
jgi:hypothetical protein